MLMVQTMPYAIAERAVSLIFGNIGYHRVIETGFTRGLRIESRIGIEIGPGNRYPARPLMGLVGLILAVFGFVTY